MSEAARRRIVVIDDELEVLRVLDGLLRQAGYDVVTTNDPSRAVETVADSAPDLVLCDITMPDRDGYDVLRALQQDPRTASYPLVFLTARREFTERVRAFRYGAVDFVGKPFTREILLRKIERILEGLEERSGTVSESGAAARALLGDAQREARTGVLTVSDPDGSRRVVLSAGHIVEGQGEAAVSDEARAEFREIDLKREDLVTHEPSALQGEVGDMPDLRSLPPHLRTVLIVDDSDEFRAFLARLLTDQGLDVHQATDGEEALRLAFIERPWLIVTDTKMPRMDGFELCRRVRSHSLIGHTPVVFLSGWDDYKHRYQALEIGADEYISKASPVRELLMRLHLILSRYAALGSRGSAGRMRGGIDAVGAVGLLQMCHLTRLTGLLSVRSGSRLIELRFREGEIVSADSDRASGREVVFEVLGWTRGYFDFLPCEVEPAPPLDGFSHLILEGCRLLDERRRER